MSQLAGPAVREQLRLDGYSPSPSVYSGSRDVTAPVVEVPSDFQLNVRNRFEGRAFLSALPEASFPAAFFDPQYRGVLEHLSYGNEGENRGQGRASLEQMKDEVIEQFVVGIDRCLTPTGHLFLWIDKFHLCTGISTWLSRTDLELVDMVTWNKMRMGMGYRTRRTAEYLMVLQKAPRRAKGVWSIHNIPDVWDEKVPRRKGVHPKPVGLQSKLIEAVTNPGDVVIDPAAGTFSVMTSSLSVGRRFLGCDLNG